tara:strand:- start:752 stop:1684 length:933 start_codon:yes stop_codon:yes gene_type:complete
MKILVTGGLGYIGSSLIPKLLDNNYHVHCLDNCMFNQKLSNTLSENKNFKFTKGDVRDYDLIKNLVKDIEAIIPLAAIVGAPLSKKLPNDTFEINQESIEKLVKFLNKDVKIIMPVSNSGYGVGEKDKFCDETSDLKPLSLYGKTKVEAEKVIMERENSISFRLATVFGPSPRMRIDLLVNNFTYIAYFEKYLKLYEPHFRRNYIHIEDIANAFMFSLNNFDNLKGEIYNLGLSEANLTKEQLCKTIKSHIDDFNYEISLEGEDEDKRDYFVSNEKIESKGFKAKISLDHGIKQLINLYSQKDFKPNKNF